MKSTINLIFIGIGILLFQAGAALLIWHYLPDWPTRGQFGDLFGSVNALFSGLAFAGLIYTISLQRTELALQREELKLTRQELSRTAQAQENSERALSAQADSMNLTVELTTINNLLVQIDRDIKLLSGSDTERIVNRDGLNRLRGRRAVLVGRLDTIYSAVTNRANGV